MTTSNTDNGHSDTGSSGGSTQTPAVPFPAAKPGQVAGGTDGTGN